MGMLDGRNALIFGLSNDRSIAWGISQALHKEGANLAFNFVGPAIEKRMRPLAESLNAKLIEECDVTSDEQIDAFFEKAKAVFPRVDILVHSVAFAQREDLEGRVRGHQPRRIPARPQRLCLFAARSDARCPAVDDGGRRSAHAYRTTAQKRLSPSTT